MITKLIQLLNREKPPRSPPLSNFEDMSHELRPCDVLLVEGRSRVSEVIRWLTNSPWTHAALYIGRIHDIEHEDIRTLVKKHYQGKKEDRLVIESLLGQGTIIRNLRVYEQEHLRICRPNRLSHADGAQVVRYAASRLGADYDVRQILDLARFLFPWYIMPRKLASSLFAPRGRRAKKMEANPRMKTVCSTMIAESFGYVHYPILPLVKQVTLGGEETSPTISEADAGGKYYFAEPASENADANGSADTTDSTGLKGSAGVKGSTGAIGKAGKIGNTGVKSKASQIQLFRRNPRLCMPSDFDYSPYFQVIKYPFLDIFHAEYQLLPWKDAGSIAEGLLSQEEEDLYSLPPDTGRAEVETIIAEAVAEYKSGRDKAKPGQAKDG